MIKTKYIEDEIFEASNETGNTVTMDMRPADDKENMGPVEMVLSAISGCMAVEIVSMLQKKRKTIIDLNIETVGTRNSDFPKFITKVNQKYILTSPDAKVEDLKKVTELTHDKYCSVASSLKADIEFEYEIVRP